MANNIYRVPTIYSDIKKTTEPLSVQVPGSKSITNRSLLLAMLAEGKSTLRGVLFSDDSRHFLKCVQDLGFETTVDEESYIVTVEGLGGKLPCEEAALNVGSAGTAARFLTATLGVSEGVFHMDSSEQMKRRPMDPLLSSLAELGCECAADCFDFVFGRFYDSGRGYPWDGVYRNDAEDDGAVRSLRGASHAGSVPYSRRSAL